MAHEQASDVPEASRHGHFDRRSLLGGAAKLAMGGLAAAGMFEMMRSDDAWALQAPGGAHPPSARMLDRLRTSYMFQISVDVATIDLGLSVATAALAAGVNIVE